MLGISDIAEILDDIFAAVHETIDWWRHHEVDPGDVTDGRFNTWADVNASLTKAGLEQLGIGWSAEVQAHMRRLRVAKYGA